MKYSHLSQIADLGGSVHFIQKAIGYYRAYPIDLDLLDNEELADAMSEFNAVLEEIGPKMTQLQLVLTKLSAKAVEVPKLRVINGKSEKTID